MTISASSYNFHIMSMKLLLFKEACDIVYDENPDLSRGELHF
jgi:hypothetical protein